VTTIPERIAFIRKIHLFSDLSEDDLNDVARALSDEQYEPGAKIIEQGTQGGSLYILFHGNVRVSRRHNNREEVLANLVRQDYFGEEELFRKRVRSASITATSKTEVLVLGREKMEELLKDAPALKPILEVVVNSHKLWREQKFKWVRKDEDVYFVARKHPILVWTALIAPLVSLLLPLGGIIFGLLVNAGWPIAISLVVLLIIVGWIVWVVVDHENDYYVVTSQRVVWVEKVVGIFDSRTEAPLGTVLSVGVETDQLGRIMDYGNVIIRTYVGKIAFNHVGRPRLAARIIEEYWGRTKEHNLAAEKDAMKDAIRKRLGLPPVALPPKPADETPAEAQTKRPGALTIVLSRFFSLRLEDGETVTYRKHSFVLLEQVWLPSLILLGLLIWWIGRIIALGSDPTQIVFGFVKGVGWQVDTLILTLPGLMVPFLLWWGYQYWDWTNDIFQVTPDQVIDIDKTPFGTEQRRAAPLENILSTESKRIGLLGNAFNYGTVYITVGGSKLEFQDVFDPATVQSDIDRRRMARQAAKAAAAAAGERERMAEWIATYHLNSEEFRNEQQKKNNPNPE